MKRGTLPGIVGAICLLLAAPAVAQNAPDIVREGSGERREALNEMELTPFDRSLLGGLTDWIGQPVSAEDLDGKPVLLVTWASWHPGSLPAAMAARQLAQAYGDRGLIVVGVHAEEGYETASDVAERRRLGFPIAKDEGSKLRTALRVDLDPDFYLIDRAGQLRFADVDRSSVRQATAMLVNETREQAEGAQERLERAASQRQAARRSIQSVAQADITQIPNWDIPAVDPVRYDDARWPPRWEAYQEAADAEWDGRRGQANLPILNLAADSVRWLKNKPSFSGRVTVMYMWSPNLPQSYRGVQEYMNQVQKDYGRDVAVVGTVVPILSGDARDLRRNQQALADAQKNMEESIRKAMTELAFEHAVAVDADYEWFATLTDQAGASASQLIRNLRRNYPFPIVVLISSDSTARWLGNPLDDRFRAALDQMVRVDPAVQIRRRLDDQYITRTGG